MSKKDIPILIKNGIIVNADAIISGQDILTKGDVIYKIGKNLDCPSDGTTIDAQGKYVIPGGIDCHTHFQFPFMNVVTIDDFFTGTKAALAGGTTTIMDFVIDPDSSLIDGYKKWRARADSKVCCDYCLHVCPTRWNEKIGEEMKTLVEEYGVNSFKMFMTYDNLQLNHEELLKIFEKCRDIGAVAMIHAEDGDMIKFNQEKLLSLGHTGPECHLHSRPEEIETAAAHSAIVIAQQVKCPLYIVHVMSKSTADIIVKKRAEGCKVFGEVIAAALGADGTHYYNESFRHAAGYVLSPPLRDDITTSSYLMDVLAGGGLQTTGSDNCTFSAEQKALGKKDFTKIPNGVNGVEDRMSVVWQRGVMTGKLRLSEFVSITSTNAAKIFNLYPEKGHIAVGSDADIVIWDPDVNREISAKTHHQAVDFNIFEGMKINGGPKYVISRGKIVMANNVMQVTAGSGRFVPCAPFPSTVYGCISLEPFSSKTFVNRDSNEKGDETNLSSVQKKEEIKTISNGRRNMHDSTLSFGSLTINETEGRALETSVKKRHPPGGHTSTSLW